VDKTPQKENGYTAIANELMEALAKYRIPGEQMQCLLFIIRKTYGYNKKDDMISNSQFVKGTGLKKGNVSRAVNSLVEKRVVIKTDNYRIPTYRFNKDYRLWRLLSKKQPVIKSDKRLLSKVMDTKVDITKEVPIVKKEIKTFDEKSDEYRLSLLLFRLMKKNNPKLKPPNLNKWAEDMDKILRIDKRITSDVERVIRWAQADDFWYSAVLSPSKLRKQIDTITLKMGPGPQSDNSPQRKAYTPEELAHIQD